MTIITLMTDFGLKDGNVGVMKGVILGIAPHAQIVDLSHGIGPQNIAEASLILFRSAPYFPAGTIHVVVVDPGVGTKRRPIAARLGEQFFVGPDNGILTMWLERAETLRQPVELVHLNRSLHWLPEVSAVFHGRDIFAPVAGHLASGAPLSLLGTPIPDPVRLALPRPEPTGRGLRGEIIHRDHFGNLSTSLRTEHLNGRRDLLVRARGVELHGLVRTFGERPEGELVALYGSTGNLILSVVNGSAADRLGLQVGEPVEVEYLTPAD